MLFALATVLAALCLVFNISWIRRNLITRFILPILSSVLPKIGDTEKAALDAGTVWWDAELFSGKPDWKKLLAYPPAEPSPEERAFLEGHVEELCRRLNDWEVTQRRDLSADVWDFIKKGRFLGMIIPKEYGGLGFSARAHADVITKLSSRCLTAAVTVMVPNSLGPAELLLHYGTEGQKRHYLPRLARGEEIPCFSLTEPEAGSDAAAVESTGVVCEGVYEGEKILGMRLNWNKRYITLGPVATLIGLAFRLSDPDGLLGTVPDLGITCALIPVKTPGITIGERHDPMGVPFQNGPHFGKDVFVPIDFIIGGRAMAGRGWMMLMQSLGAGRGISLPALSAGGAQLALRIVSSYTFIREQFHLPIGRFEGIEEVIARMAGETYRMNAARQLTLGALDAGEKPAVVTAIVKAYLTEAMRRVVNDAMDVCAGAAIMQGPRNLLGPLYKAVPIGITVEGANILTRSLIIYGQGAMRCHPFIQKEIQAVENRDLVALDTSFFGHAGFVIRNVFRSALFGLTGGLGAGAPVKGPSRKYFRQLSRLSTNFAVLSDAAMATLGGGLKRHEKITGRLADAVAWMYIASATLKQYHHHSHADDLPLLQWSVEDSLYRVQTALQDVLRNLPNRFVAVGLSFLLFPGGAFLKPPSDRLGARVVASLKKAGVRERLTSGIYIPNAPDSIMESLALLEAAFQNPTDEKLKQEAIQVDAFDPKIFLGLKS